jgi:GNAT superfamily N-acetyltransferase
MKPQDKIADWFLRGATSNDMEFLWQLHCATMKGYIAKTWGWDEEWQRRHFTEYFVPARIQIIGRGNEDVGMIVVERHLDRMFLASMEITPKHQRIGLGSAIIGSLLAKADKRHVPVDLQVLKVNPARVLYERLGFTLIEETPTHYRMRYAKPAFP